MTLERYRRDWRDDELTGIGLDSTPTLTLPPSKPPFVRCAGSAGRVRSSARLEELSLAVFDRTFKVTEVLRVLAGVVAFLGILSALLAIELERARELERAAHVRFHTGRARRDAAHADRPARRRRGTCGRADRYRARVAARARDQSALVRVDDGLRGHAASLLAGVSLAVVAALLAGIYPAWRASRIELGGALRED